MPLKVIGAGLARTGTLSLKVALEQLGLRPCYHMVEVWTDLPCIDDWIEAADGRPDWDKIFAGYEATVDYPGCHFWRELMAEYSDAKVVLSVRDPNRWFESTQATVFSPQSRALLGDSPLRTFMEKTVWNDFGSAIDDRDHMVAAFERHVAEVQRAVPRDRLLVFDVTQGWQPLCEFLGVPIPGTPFPRLNSRAEMAARVATGTRRPATLDAMVARAKELTAELLKLSE